MAPRFDAPECEHGTPGGSAATCALCRVALLAAHGATKYRPRPFLLPPGVRPMPKDFRDRVTRARQQPGDLPDWREHQLPLGDRDS